MQLAHARGKAKGKSEFDAAKLESILRGCRFHLYMIMVVHVNEIPVEWANQLELCVCHRDLFNALNGYQISCVLNAH